MKLSILTFIYLILITSCSPENVDPCSPEVVDGKKFLGYANICNAMPQEQLYFKALVSVAVVDTFLNISLVSQDSTLSFEYKDTLVYKCYEVEPNYFVYPLYKNGLEVASIGPHAFDISINLKVEGCENSSSYDGVLIN